MASRSRTVFADWFRNSIRRDYRNRSLGQADECFVLGLERRQLAEAGREDLARKVRWVAAEDGDGAGYNVQSFDLSGCARLLEVKTTNGPHGRRST